MEYEDKRYVSAWMYDCKLTMQEENRLTEVALRHPKALELEKMRHMRDWAVQNGTLNQVEELTEKTSKLEYEMFIWVKNWCSEHAA